MEPRIVILCGPTASGKSALATALAEQTGGVIINADSQQLYRELRILTARPGETEELAIPHRLYGILSAQENGSASLWMRYAKMEIDWALSMKQLPIIVGGTGLYIKTLMHGIAEIPDIPSAIREQAKNDFEYIGAEAFHLRLQAVDAVAAARIRVSDTQRLIRAYEVWLGTGKPLSFWHKSGNNPFYPESLFRIVHVSPEREKLYQSIDQRVLAMLEDGAVDEVRQLLSLQLPDDLPAMRIIGVPELRAYLEGHTALEEATTRIQQMTRNYAKRQITWFRHQLTPHISGEDFAVGDILPFIQ